MLFITKIVTPKPIKDTNKSKGIKDWYVISYLDLMRKPYIFKSTGLPVRLYYPANKAGTKIITLMCDCFKKGNLFAFNKDRFVRHGRVHKKTSLDPNGFGYPDDTYEMRVTGELMDMGSTTYTQFFGEKKNVHSPFVFYDNYPDEKRWIIETNIVADLKPADPVPILADVGYMDPKLFEKK